MIIMDFAKAFDKVPNRRLLYKLDYYGIRGSTHKWITSWLSGRFQKVVLDGQASDPVPVLSGVPQGSVLGPVLFLIFINDLPENIRSSVRLFADDCVLYRNIESHTDCQILQDDLNSLAQWEADWQMKFNIAKCHSMRVTRHPPDKHKQFEYTLHQQRLEQGGRTGLMVRASDSGSGDPGSILGRVGVFISLSKRYLLPKKYW